MSDSYEASNTEAYLNLRAVIPFENKMVKQIGGRERESIINGIHEKLKKIPSYTYLI